MGWKRDEILIMAAQKPDRVISKKEITETLGGSYYYNASKHLGDIIGRLIKSGHLSRVKPGLYKLEHRARLGSHEEVNKDQLKLF